MNALIIEDEFRNANRLRKMLVDIDPEMRIDGPLETVIKRDDAPCTNISLTSK